MSDNFLFSDAANAYLHAVRADYEREASWKRIAVSLRAMSGFLGGLRLVELTTSDIEDFKQERLQSLKPVSVRHDLISLGLFLRHARRQDWIRTDLLDGVKIPSDKDAVHIRVVELDEERRYLAAALSDGKLYLLVKLMLATGMRPGEVRMLRVADFELHGRTIAIRKGQSRAARRTLKLVGDVFDLMEAKARGRAASEFLIPGRSDGNPFAPMNNAHNDACVRAGLVNAAGRREIRIYDFRHTFATRMAGRGMPLTTLAAILGHSNLRCVMCYVHPSQAAMDDALLKFAG